MAATKILILRKLTCTINLNAVRGRSHKHFFTRKFIIQKFLYTKISRSMVCTCSGACVRGVCVWGGGRGEEGGEGEEEWVNTHNIQSGCSGSS